ncbi:unnamed protein product [Scytosiphon promiscuus]
MSTPMILSAYRLASSVVLRSHQQAWFFLSSPLLITYNTKSRISVVAICTASCRGYKGIFRSLVGGVTDMLATTDGIARTQDALLSTSRGLLEELRLHDTARQADAINGRSEKIRETCAALERVSDRLAALRRRASVLEAELEADGCVAGDGVSELCL